MSLHRDMVIEIRDIPPVRNWFNSLSGEAAELWITPDETLPNGKHEGQTPNVFNQQYVTAYVLPGPGNASLVLVRMRVRFVQLLLDENPPPAGFEILASVDPFESDLTDEDGNVTEIRGDVFRAVPANKHANIRAIWARTQQHEDGPVTRQLRFAGFAGHHKPEFIEP